MSNNLTISKTGPTSPQEWEQMRQSRPETKEVIISIKKAARARDWDAAQEAFTGVENPDPLVYNAIIHAADACNRFDDAFQLFSQMQEAGLPLSAVTFSPLVRLAGRSRRLEKAKQLAEEMQSAGIALNGHIYSALIDAHKFARDVEGALEVWQEMKRLDVPVTESSLCSIMAAVAVLGDVSRSEELLREVHPTIQLNIAHYNCVLLACRKAGDPDSAQRVLREMKEKGIRPDVIAYTSLLVSMRAAGRPTVEMDAMLQQMAADGVRPDAIFVEEHLAHISGVPIGSDLRAARLNEQSPEVLERLGAVVREAREAGIGLTSYTLDLEDRLKLSTETCSHSAPRASVHGDGSEWVKVLTKESQGADAGQGGEYYWDRVSGRTQWEKPLGPITTVIQAA